MREAILRHHRQEQKRLADLNDHQHNARSYLLLEPNLIHYRLNAIVPFQYKRRTVSKFVSK